MHLHACETEGTANVQLNCLWDGAWICFSCVVFPKLNMASLKLIIHSSFAMGPTLKDSLCGKQGLIVDNIIIYTGSH